MKAIMAAALAAMVILSCGRKFGVRDRFEGVHDGMLRVYVRDGNPQGYDDDDGAAQLGKAFGERGRERAALLVSAGGIAADRELPAEGTIVHFRCNDDFCEAFIDFRIREEKKQGNQEKK